MRQRLVLKAKNSPKRAISLTAKLLVVSLERVVSLTEVITFVESRIFDHQLFGRLQSFPFFLKHSQ